VSLSVSEVQQVQTVAPQSTASVLVRAAQYVRETLYAGRCTLTGRGGRHLLHKRELHQRRAAAERRMLCEARSDGRLMHQNVCPACGQRQLPRREFENPLGFRFAICPEDGTVFMDPILSDEALARLYNDPAESYHWLEDSAQSDVSVRPSNEEDYRAILRLLAPRGGERLLDVGCATGSFLFTARATFDVEGCELSAATAETARANGLAVHTGRIEDLPGAGQFDVVTMLQVIEHLPVPEQSLSHVVRLLRSGGHLYVNTPNVDSASFQLLGARHVHVSSFGHVSLFTRRSLELLGARCGLTLVAHEDCGGMDFELHDWLSLRLAPGRFRHRMACYSPRFYFLCQTIERLSLGLAARLARPRGCQSYQRALFRKAAAA
jgi:SAM-dependent methyltransferase